MIELRHFPIFETAPSPEFVEGFLLHVEQTGRPETYPGISTVRPTIIEGVRFLTDRTKVVTSLREGGEWCPCALCRPTSPKFQIGRLAYFPGEKTVCFVGADCAQKHMGDNYRQAEDLWQKQSRAARFIRIWPQLQARLPELEAFAAALLPVVRALELMRGKLDADAPLFRQGAYDALKWSQGMIHHDRDIGVKDPSGKPVLQRFELGVVPGFDFLRRDFHPYSDLKREREAIKNIAQPLPSLVDNEDPEALDEINRRGRKALSVWKGLNKLRDAAEESREFLSDKTLKLFADWFKTAQSPWSELEFKRTDNVILLRSQAHFGAGYCNLTLLREVSSDLPEKLEEMA